jgi:4-amino-4-deoxychorismate lyase
MSLLACRINGVDTTRIEVGDRGFQYGDGLFETIAVSQGKAEFLHDHLRRLAEGARQLQIPCPPETQWQTDIKTLLEGQDRAVLKLMLTRGQGGRGYVWPDSPEVTRVVMLHAWPDYPTQNAEQGVRATFCRTTLAPQPLLAGFKHLNRLEQVLARNEWQQGEYDEGLMRDQQGQVISGTMSNLFLVKDDQLHTPDLSACGVNGIMRQMVIMLAKQHHIPVSIGEYYRADVEAADGVFLTNSLIGIWPVRELEGISLTVSSLVKDLQEKLASLRLQ